MSVNDTVLKLILFTQIIKKAFCLLNVLLFLTIDLYLLMSINNQPQPITT